jgi:hypothetical protein
LSVFIILLFALGDDQNYTQVGPTREAASRRHMSSAVRAWNPGATGFTGGERSGEIAALVMELVEGPALAERIAVIHARRHGEPRADRG